VTFALPACPPGGIDVAQLRAETAAWVASPELAFLITHFGGEPPAAKRPISGQSPAAKRPPSGEPRNGEPRNAEVEAHLAEVLDELAEFSAAWDFRAGRFERYDTERVNYEPGIDGRIRAAIEVLGLGGKARPRHDFYDHVLVLGGGIRVALGRTGYAGHLVRHGIKAGSVAALGSLRPRNDLELAEAFRLGLEGVETEADMMDVGIRRAFGLEAPVTRRAGDGWWVKTYPDAVHVVAAPSTRPGMRANTADTLVGWATHVGAPHEAQRVLVVTNDPYARLQHCDAMRLLAVPYGCGVETVRLDAAHDAAWVRPLSTTELLQEVRSSILAMRALYREASIAERNTRDRCS
jgi:hypothetical protein